MFTYYHCYLPETWDAQVKAGLIDEHAGVRFMHSSMANENDKFNVTAAMGTDFQKMMAEKRLPMYIDRLQGGIFFEEYDFDQELLDYYKELLGDNFKGFQMHEWMSNLASDILRINDCLEGEWTEKNITASLLKAHPYPMPFIEAQSAAEHEKSGNPKTYDEFYKAAYNMFLKRMQKCNNQLIPADSLAIAYKLEIDNGVKMLMPEVGAQIPNTRIQIAYARGMARTNGIPFGIYYEPWGGEPFSACCYQRDDQNEWKLGKAADFPFITNGENGGSSRALQKRIHLYGYFAGAEFMSEEWGMCNTFYDWENFELTPYGKIKYDFLQLVKKYPKEKIGSPYTPIALVLSKDLSVLSTHHQGDDFFGYKLPNSIKDKMVLARKGIKELLSNSVEMIGSETNIIINSDIPDCIDIIHEDNIEYGDYKYFVNLTASEKFEKEHRCCKIEEVPQLLKELLPCSVDVGVHWFVNKTESGWLLVMINNSGVKRTVEKGDEYLPEGDKQVKITLKDNKTLTALEGGEDLEFKDGKYTLTLKSGEWFLGEF